MGRNILRNEGTEDMVDGEDRRRMKLSMRKYKQVF